MSTNVSGYAAIAALLAMLTAGWFAAWPVWRRVSERAISLKALGSRGVTALLVMFALACAVAFTLLTAAVLESSTAFGLDRAAASAAESLRVAPLMTLFSWITRLGDTATILVGAAVGLAMYAAYNRAQPLWPYAVTVLGAQATTWLGKYVVAKPRPDLSHLAPALQAVSPSFPSAHASGSLSVYGFLGYLAIRTIHSHRLRAEAAYGVFALVALIGLSRIFHGVHYATDVLGGWLLGGFWLCLGIAEDVRARERGNRAAPGDAAPPNP